MGAIIIPFLTQVSYLRLVELPESPPRPLNPRGGSGRSFPGYHGWLPPLFKTSVEVAVQSETTVGELKILSKLNSG